jgi:hypothetical protein
VPCAQVLGVQGHDHRRCFLLVLGQRSTQEFNLLLAKST